MKPIIKIITLFFIGLQTNGQCWQSVSSGLEHTLAIKSNGTLWAWGRNDNGQLGNGTIINTSSPIQIGTDTNWKIVSGGANHSAGVKTDGTLWSWGDNYFGQLGNGLSNNGNTLVPTQIGADTNWSTVDCGYFFCVALKGSFSKTLWTWGYNEYGQLGDSTNVNVNVPQQIGVSSSWYSVSAGAYHTMALEFVLGGNRLMGWGLNQYGQLGDGTFFSKNIPTQCGTALNWQTVVTGYFHSLGKKTTGTLWAWGINGDGQIGNGSNASSINTPNQVGTDSDWQGVLAAGYQYSMAKKSNGTLWSWGRNTFGGAGLGAVIFSYLPLQIGASTNWGLHITASQSFGAALGQDGSLSSWGLNDKGQLGNGTITSSTVPNSIICPTNLNINLQDSIAFTIKIFPNPASDFLTIQTSNNTTITVIKIIDVLGKIAFETDVVSNTINIQKLAKGIYIMQVFAEDKMYQQKFIKN